MASRQQSLKKLYFFLPVASIIFFWAILYLPNLRSVPTWYGDETLSVTAAGDLLEGKFSQRAIWNSFWTPYAPYQPGFQYLMAAGLMIFDGDILGPRFFSTLIGLATALCIFLGGRKIFGIFPSWAAALVLLGYEQAIIHYRWVFTHNLVGFGILLSLLALLRKPNLKRDTTAGLGFAIGFSALPIAVYGLFCGVLLRLRRPASWVPLVLPSVVVVSGSLLAGYLLHAPTNFLFHDLAATARFYTSASLENSGSIAGVARNFFNFSVHDWFHGLALLALLICLSRKKTRPLAFFGLLLLLLLVQNRQNLPVFYYQAMLLLPVLAVAMGGAFFNILFFLGRAGMPLKLLRFINRASVPCVILLLLLPAIPASIQGKLTPRIQYWTTQSIPEVEAVAAWLNENTEQEDLVICHHNIAWLLHCRTADFLQATTWAGLPTWPFDQPLPKEQFVYPADPLEARFIVFADIDDRWTLHQPNVRRMVDESGVANWPKVWRGNHYRVYRNPGFGLERDE